MKCLLCSFVSNDSEDLKEHYIDFYKVDRDNHFFVFCLSFYVFRLRKCLRCNEFLLNHRFKINHDFLVNYGKGRYIFEEKPVSYTRLRAI